MGCEHDDEDIGHENRTAINDHHRHGHEFRAQQQEKSRAREHHHDKPECRINGLGMRDHPHRRADGDEAENKVVNPADAFTGQPQYHRQIAGRIEPEAAKRRNAQQSPKHARIKTLARHHEIERHSAQNRRDI